VAVITVRLVDWTLDDPKIMSDEEKIPYGHGCDVLFVCQDPSNVDPVTYYVVLEDGCEPVYMCEDCGEWVIKVGRTPVRTPPIRYDIP
jgi:hypothetical protein